MSGFGGFDNGGGYGDSNGGGFGGFGGDNGGGFGGGFMQGGSTQSPINKGSERIDSLTPVTVRQTTTLEESPTGQLILDGRPIQRVCIVARIIRVEKKEVNVVFTLSDGTGEISGRWFLDPEGDDPSERFGESMYVKVFGKVRAFNNKVSINLESLKLVQDQNQITHHFLNVVFTHLQVTKEPINKSILQQSSSTGAVSSQFNSTDSYPGAHQVNSPLNMPTGQSIQSSNGGMGDLKQVLLSIFNRAEVEELDAGFSVQMAFAEVKKLGHAATEAQVKDEIQHLSNDGHLYSTVDDDHFKSTGEVA